MPRYLIKLEDNEGCAWYMEWSTITDAPASFAMPLDIFEKWYAAEFGRDGRNKWDERMARVEAKGTSSLIDKSADAVLANNNAGPEGQKISATEIIERYRFDRQEVIE